MLPAFIAHRSPTSHAPGFHRSQEPSLSCSRLSSLTGAQPLMPPAFIAHRSPASHAPGFHRSQEPNLSCPRLSSLTGAQPLMLPAFIAHRSPASHAPGFHRSQEPSLSCPRLSSLTGAQPLMPLAFIAHSMSRKLGRNMAILYRCSDYSVWENRRVPMTTRHISCPQKLCELPDKIRYDSIVLAFVRPTAEDKKTHFGTQSNGAISHPRRPPAKPEKPAKPPTR